MRIVCLCLNPAIDVSSTATRVLGHRKTRTSGQTIDPGGGGINVARVLEAFGVGGDLVYLSGGLTGPLLESLLDPLPVARHRVPIVGDVRISCNVLDLGSGIERRFVPAGPEVSREEIDSLLERLHGLALGPDDLLVLSGSLPRGVPADFTLELIAFAAACGARVVLDTSGDGLTVALERAPSPLLLVKPSIGELERVVGHALDEAGVRRAAGSLVEQGRVDHVVVSMGAQGLMLVDRDGALRLPAHRVPVKSAVGAGDSLLGALLSRLAHGDDMQSACRYGLAAGAAAVMSGGAALCTQEATERLLAAGESSIG